jgi:hypothetical protein
MILRPMRSISVAVLLAVTLVLALPSLMGRSGMKAATCVTNPVVVNNADSGPGSLRQAILDACDGSTIKFSSTVASPITLLSELAIDKNLTIQGRSTASGLTISGNNAVRVFNIGRVNPAINVTLSGLTIANGSATLIIPGGEFTFPGAFGGGIFNASTGTLTLSNSVVSGNNATVAGQGGSGGGGIANASSGTVNVINSKISGNTARFFNSGEGGGIGNLAFGAVNVTDSTFSSNSALAGGGISNLRGTVTVSNSAFSGNSSSSECCGSEGGGISNDFPGTVTITGSIFSGNSAVDGFGGAIENIGLSVVVNSSTFTGNTATGDPQVRGGVGGAIENEGVLTVNNSFFSGNSAADAGGIYNIGEATITGSTFSTNFANAGRGVIENATLFTAETVSNCTVSGNVAITAGSGIPANGFFNFVGTANINNSTFSGNEGGISIQFGTTNVENTISAGNTLSDVTSAFFDGFTSLGHNLIGKAAFTTGFINGVNGDQVGSMASPINPKLGPLQNNGGPTPTMALLPGSPAIDAGDDSVLGSPLFLTTDQRGPGFPRKSGLHVDIGAFEVQVRVQAPVQACLKDIITGNVFQFDSTGKYKFTRCSDGFMVSGTGVVTLVNGILTLTDSKPDRRVSAGFITSQRTGSATIYIMIAPGVWQTFRINSTNPAAVCSC